MILAVQVHYYNKVVDVQFYLQTFLRKEAEIFLLIEDVNHQVLQRREKVEYYSSNDLKGEKNQH